MTSATDPAARVSRDTPAVWTVWTTAARDLGRRWRSGAPEAPARHDRRLEAMAALLLCVAIVVTGVVADTAVARAAHGLSPSVVRFFSEVTKIGESGWIFLLAAIVALGSLLLARRVAPRAAAGYEVLAGRATFLFATNALSGIASQVLKHIAGRARPKYLDMVGPFHFDLFSLNASYASFPSGHTITAFACASAMALFLPRWRWPLLALAALVALSRLAVGAHYPSDVLAGAIIGVATTFYLARACAARRLVFRRGPDGRLDLRGRGLIWPALVGLRERNR